MAHKREIFLEGSAPQTTPIDLPLSWPPKAKVPVIALIGRCRGLRDNSRLQRSLGHDPKPRPAESLTVADASDDCGTLAFGGRDSGQQIGGLGGQNHPKEMFSCERHRWLGTLARRTCHVLGLHRGPSMRFDVFRLLHKRCPVPNRLSQ